MATRATAFETENCVGFSRGAEAAQSLVSERGWSSALASEIDNDAETIALIRYSLAPPNAGVTITIAGVPSRLAIARGPINVGAASSSGYARLARF
jgi:hypothetical protein